MKQLKTPVLQSKNQRSYSDAVKIRPAKSMHGLAYPASSARLLISLVAFHFSILTLSPPRNLLVHTQLPAIAVVVAIFVVMVASTMPKTVTWHHGSRSAQQATGQTGTHLRTRIGRGAGDEGGYGTHSPKRHRCGGPVCGKSNADRWAHTPLGGKEKILVWERTAGRGSCIRLAHHDGGGCGGRLEQEMVEW